MHKFLLFLVFVFLIPLSCNDTSRLEKREQILAEKEQRFALKEAEYLDLLKMRDSIMSKKDTLIDDKNWPSTIAGKWNGKIICKESSCSDYAVGDLRNDTWEFVSDSLNKSVNVYNINNQLVRTYSAKMENEEIKLNFHSDSTSAKKVEMNVVLNSFSPKKIQGNRTVSVNSNCSASFTVELSRP